MCRYILIVFSYEYRFCSFNGSTQNRGGGAGSKSNSGIQRSTCLLAASIATRARAKGRLLPLHLLRAILLLFESADLSSY